MGRPYRKEKEVFESLSLKVSTPWKASTAEEAQLDGQDDQSDGLSSGCPQSPKRTMIPSSELPRYQG